MRVSHSSSDCFGLVISVVAGGCRKAKRVGENLINMLSSRIGYFKSGLYMAALMVGVLTSCNKEDSRIDPTGANDGPEIINTKINHRFLAFSGGSAPYSFTVKKVNCTWGVAENSDNSYGHVVYSGQNPTQYTSQLYCNASSSACIFDKGPNSSTGGPVYRIKANQGGTPATRKTLVVQVKGLEVFSQSNCGAWFTYNVASNQWVACSGASTYFVWSTEVGEVRCGS